MYRQTITEGAYAMPPLDKVYDYSQYGGLLVEKQDKVMTITLNAPESMNAFSAEMHYSMSRIWEDVHDDSEVNVVVLTGAGRAVSAGGNVIVMQQKIDRPELWDATSLPEAKRIIFRMLECDKPIIARVNGHAVGLGATVALMCDIIIAAEEAKIGDPHVNAGRRFAANADTASWWSFDRLDCVSRLRLRSIVACAICRSGMLITCFVQRIDFIAPAASRRASP